MPKRTIDVPVSLGEGEVDYKPVTGEVIAASAGGRLEWFVVHDALSIVDGMTVTHLASGYKVCSLDGVKATDSVEYVRGLAEQTLAAVFQEHDVEQVRKAIARSPVINPILPGGALCDF